MSGYKSGWGGERKREGISVGGYRISGGGGGVSGARLVLYTCGTLSKSRLITKKCWGWRDVVKNAYYDSTGPEFSVQDQHWAAQKQGIPSIQPPI